MKDLKDIQHHISKGIPDVKKLAEFKERETWYRERAKIAARCEEVIGIARHIQIENPSMDPTDALSVADKFHEAAKKWVDVALEGYSDEDEPKESGIAVI